MNCVRIVNDFSMDVQTSSLLIGLMPKWEMEFTEHGFTLKPVSSSIDPIELTVLSNSYLGIHSVDDFQKRWNRTGNGECVTTDVVDACGNIMALTLRKVSPDDTDTVTGCTPDPSNEYSIVYITPDTASIDCISEWAIHRYGNQYAGIVYPYNQPDEFKSYKVGILIRVF